MKTRLLYLPVAMALLCGALFCQTPAQKSAPPKDPPDPPIDYSVQPAEAKDLRIAQLEFQMAQRDVNAALQSWIQACETLRVAKKWPEGTTCNIQTGGIVPPRPKPVSGPVPAPAPAPLKDEPKK